MVRPFCNIIMKNVYSLLKSVTLPLAFSIHISCLGWGMKKRLLAVLLQRSVTNSTTLSFQPMV
jgi:hypothetical protein